MALSIASKVCELTKCKDHNYFETLALAYTEQGDFDNAVRWQTWYIELTALEAAKQSGLQRLKLYAA